MKEKTLAVMNGAPVVDGTPAPIEHCLYWVFEMKSFHLVHEFYMITLYRDDGFDRDREVDHLHVGFFTNYEDMQRALRNESFTYAQLVLPWASFARAARDLLSGKKKKHSFQYRGTLSRESKDTVLYMTACGVEYRIAVDELKALLT